MFFLRLQFKLADGTQRILVTDDSWQCGAKPAAGWMDLIFKADGWSESFARAAVDERLQIPDGRRIDLAASDNYEQWRLASGEKGGAQPAKFSITPGFRIELVRAAAASDGSWISLVFDPQGRAIISQEQEGLLRMTLAKDGSSVQSVERINDDLKEVRGMAFFGRDLYVNANNSKAMYRLRGDTASRNCCLPRRGASGTDATTWPSDRTGRFTRFMETTLMFTAPPKITR
jgi:hypothetical protein